MLNLMLLTTLVFKGFGRERYFYPLFTSEISKRQLTHSPLQKIEESLNFTELSIF